MASTQPEHLSLHRTFGPVWDGAGARGFSGEGYWYHRLVPGLDFTGSTFVSKTITTFGTKGNMLLTRDYRPLKLFPDCIDVNLTEGIALNAVGLSGPSVRQFLATRRWHTIQEPFLISWMPVLGDDDPRHHREIPALIEALKEALRSFASDKVGLQLNISCPNVGADMHHLTEKAWFLLNMLSELKIPIVVKLNLLVPPDAAAHIARHRACSGICIANTIPFGTVLPSDWWQWKFSAGSPLAVHGYGGGGLSGWVLLQYVAWWVREFRTHDITTHVNAGGGILHADDVDVLADVGASSIFFASVAMMRPWRVRSIIARGHKLLG